MEKYLKIQRVATFIIFLITLGGVIECFVNGRHGTILWAAAANILSAALWCVLGDLMTTHKKVEAIYGAIQERERRIDELKEERSKYLAMLKSAAGDEHNLEQPEVPEETPVQTKSLKAAAPKKKQYRNKASGVKKDVQAVKDGRQD